MKLSPYSLPVAVGITSCLLFSAAAEADVADSWIDIVSASGPDNIQSTSGGLKHCGGVRLADTPGHLVALPSVGVIASLEKLELSEDSNLLTEEAFGDCEVYLEFMIAKDSNSGVKLQNRYEVQLYDSFGRDRPTARDCGGIYPHWRTRPDGKGADYLDAGVPPATNAAKRPGEWQTLSIVFRAPRFDESGRKILNARFKSVSLNGQVVQQNVEVDSPTGNASTPLAETPQAPLRLQMDHGAVAFRNVRVRPL